MAAATSNIAESVKKILKDHNKDQGDLIGILQDVQAQFKYLPREALDAVAKGLGLPINRVFSVATFFRAFYLEPRGKHDCAVCTGTACHVRGADRIVDEIGRMLKIAPGQTSKDRKFSLNTVNCLGACALGPVVTVDGEIHGKITPKSIRKVFEKYEQSTKGNEKNEVVKRSGTGKSKAKSTRKPRSK